MPSHRPLAGLALGFLGVVIFGLTLPATRHGVEVFGPWFLTSARATIAGTCGLALLLAARRPFPRDHAVRLLAATVCVVVGFPGFTGLAMASVPAVHGGVVLAVLPLATAIAATLVTSERPSPLFWFWSVAGAALVAGFVLRQGVGAVHLADLWLLLAGASAALGYALFGSLGRHLPAREQISWAVAVSLPFTATATLLLWQPSYASASASHWLALGYLGLFSMFLGFFAWNAGLALGGIASVSQVQLLQTFVTLVAAALLLGETVDPMTLAFAVATVAVVAMARRARVAQRPA